MATPPHHRLEFVDGCQKSINMQNICRIDGQAYIHLLGFPKKSIVSQTQADQTIVEVFNPVILKKLANWSILFVGFEMLRNLFFIKIPLRKHTYVRI